MSPLTCYLLTDGSSDARLRFVIDWILVELGVEFEASRWADLRILPNPPNKLDERIALALTYYPCDLLIVHRDAESVALDVRLREVHDAANAVPTTIAAVVPVRMTEAWLLGDEAALRRAAGNPRGTTPLGIPPRARWESIDAKRVLLQALKAASGLHGRRLDQFASHRAAFRVAELIGDFKHLRGLTSFDAAVEELRHALQALGRWPPPPPSA